MFDDILWFLTNSYIKYQKYFQKLASIKLWSYLDINKIWLKQVFKENSLSEGTIYEIIRFEKRFLSGDD
jgi:hypothetical protein